MTLEEGLFPHSLFKLVNFLNLHHGIFSLPGESVQLGIITIPKSILQMSDCCTGRAVVGASPQCIRQESISLHAAQIASKVFLSRAISLAYVSDCFVNPPLALDTSSHGI